MKGEGRVRASPDGYTEFLVVPESETKTSVPITLSQKDVREIQLAKAAIRTGLDILMEEAGLDASEVGTLHIAGAFGFFLNPLSAEAIGLYPDIDVRKIRLVGNTALAGARALLLSTKTRRAAVDLAKRVEHVDLARHEKFKEEFMKSIPLSRT